MSELAELNALLAPRDDARSTPCTIVGFTMLLDQYDADSRFPCNPGAVDPQWTFMGWDVAEETLLRGLMNMGYRADKKAFAVEHFADGLNELHLFDQAALAMRFATWANTRDAGHGPFYVCGLYQIDV